MPNYTFTFKKDDIYVEFSTTDKDIVERQFKVWVLSASEYTRKQKLSEEEKKNLESAIATEKLQEIAKSAVSRAADVVVEPEKQEEQKPQATIVEEQAPAPKTVQEPVQAPVQEAEIVKKQPEVSENQAPEVVEEKEVFDKASDLLRTINTIQNEPEQEAKEVSVEPVPAALDFEKVLEGSLENPTFEPEKAKDKRFLKIVEEKSTRDRFHYFIITAYYLLEFEKLERFSLKQINAKLMQNLSVVIDHTILQSAIDQGFVEIVPDLTGTSEIGEYKLTEKGEDFYVNKI